VNNASLYKNPIKVNKNWRSKRFEHQFFFCEKILVILVADEDFRVGERAKAEGVDIRSMTEAAGVA
jgi:hypothetical protein